VNCLVMPAVCCRPLTEAILTRVGASVDSISALAFVLGDGQDQSPAGSAAGAAKITRVPARSIDLHAGCSCSGDQSGRDRDLQLLTAYGLSA